MRGLAAGDWVALVLRFSFTFVLTLALLFPSVELVCPDTVPLVVPDIVPDDDGGLALGLVLVF